jgi:hypothetical protein
MTWSCSTCDGEADKKYYHICDANRDKYCKDCLKNCTLCGEYCCFECNKDTIDYYNYHMDTVYHKNNCDKINCECEYLFCLKCFKLCDNCDSIIVKCFKCSKCS